MSLHLPMQGKYPGWVVSPWIRRLTLAKAELMQLLRYRIATSPFSRSRVVNRSGYFGNQFDVETRTGLALCALRKDGGEEEEEETKQNRKGPLHLKLAEAARRNYRQPEGAGTQIGARWWRHGPLSTLRWWWPKWLVGPLVGRLPSFDHAICDDHDAGCPFPRALSTDPQSVVAVFPNDLLVRPFVIRTYWWRPSSGMTSAVTAIWTWRRWRRRWNDWARRKRTWAWKIWSKKSTRIKTTSWASERCAHARHLRALHWTASAFNATRPIRPFQNWARFLPKVSQPK